MKKHKTKDAIKHLFPTFSRIFSEKNTVKNKITKKVIFLFLLWIVFLIPISVISMQTYTSFVQIQRLENEHRKIEEEILFWGKMVNQYTDFRDGYFQLALLEYRLKNFDLSRRYLEKTLLIDPNFKEGRDFEKVLR